MCDRKPDYVCFGVPGHRSDRRTRIVHFGLLKPGHGPAPDHTEPLVLCRAQRVIGNNAKSIQVRCTDPVLPFER